MQLKQFQIFQHTDLKSIYCLLTFSKSFKNLLRFISITNMLKSDSRIVAGILSHFKIFCQLSFCQEIRSHQNWFTDGAWSEAWPISWILFNKFYKLNVDTYHSVLQSVKIFCNSMSITGFISRDTLSIVLYVNHSSLVELPCITLQDDLLGNSRCM